ncbi:hypothetical protein T492DRAFT_542843 [Pavlovales sp. CCMP2436]|nr:hypothetical protein T492DRAFT_542843 [Pavlovales sp. CCMP2436]
MEDLDVTMGEAVEEGVAVEGGVGEGGVGEGVTVEGALHPGPSGGGAVVERSPGPARKGPDPDATQLWEPEEVIACSLPVERSPPPAHYSSVSLFSSLITALCFETAVLLNTNYIIFACGLQCLFRAAAGLRP